MVQYSGRNREEILFDCKQKGYFGSCGLFGCNILAGGLDIRLPRGHGALLARSICCWAGCY